LPPASPSPIGRRLATASAAWDCEVSAGPVILMPAERSSGSATSTTGKNAVARSVAICVSGFSM
jgi:hypothetical protein